MTLPVEIQAAAGRGWRMFPCKARGKKPLVKGWPEQARCDITQLQTWAAQHPGCNWGLACGPKSGVWVLDLDSERGMDWLNAQVDAGRELPETWAVQTGSGGLHCYFQWPDGLDVRNSVSKIAPGVDVRGQRGCVIAAGSTHPSGKVYEAVDPSCPVADAPQWLLAMVQSEPKPARVRDAPTWDRIPEGQRNSKLTSIGGGLRRKGDGLPEIESHLLEANARRCQPPLPDAEVRQIAASVSRYPVGGDDPLQCAWKAACSTGEPKGYAGFLKLARTLQASRGEQEIALPLKRIAELFGVHWTTVSRWRKFAFHRGILECVTQYRAHRRAACYRLNAHDGSEDGMLTKPQELTIGLVSIGGNPHSVHSANLHSVHSDDPSTSFPFGCNAASGGDPHWADWWFQNAAEPATDTEAECLSASLSETPATLFEQKPAASVSSFLAFERGLR